MNGYIHCYLRASTKEQDATRARGRIEAFLAERGLRAAGWYIENESGTKLNRPELMKILEVAQPNDSILIEQVDRLSRLNAEDWTTLRRQIEQKGLSIVALDMPTSWSFLKGDPDDFNYRINMALNSMMLETLAAVARKDYLDRKTRQREGIERARAQGRYRGKQANKEKHEQVIKLRESGYKIDDIVKLTELGRSTVFLILKKNKENI